MLNLYLEQIQQTIFQDARRAWIFLCLFYLLVTLLVKFLLDSPIRKASKRISSKNLKSLHSIYLFKSVSGWLLYLLALGLFLLFWYTYYFKTFDLQNDALCFAASSVALFLFSIIFHLCAYAASALEQIKKLEDQQLTP